MPGCKSRDGRDILFVWLRQAEAEDEETDAVAVEPFSWFMLFTAACKKAFSALAGEDVELVPRAAPEFKQILSDARPVLAKGLFPWSNASCCCWWLL